MRRRIAPWAPRRVPRAPLALALLALVVRPAPLDALFDAGGGSSTFHAYWGSVDAEPPSDWCVATTRNPATGGTSSDACAPKRSASSGDLVVVLGGHAGHRTLVQILPAFVPMHARRLRLRGPAIADRRSRGRGLRRGGGPLHDRAPWVIIIRLASRRRWGAAVRDRSPDRNHP